MFIQKTFILCALLLTAFCSPAEAQTVLVVPIEVGFNDVVVDNSKTFGQVITGDDSYKVNYQNNDEEQEKLKSALQPVIERSLRNIGKKAKMIAEDELDEATLAEINRLAFSIAGSPKSSLIGNKRYQDQMSNMYAPLVNKLCDQFGGDQVLFIYVNARNAKKNYKANGKDPSGTLTVTGTLLNGDSGLIDKKKTTNKGGTIGPSRVRYVKLTTEKISGIVANMVESFF